jgi:hypothetical protein
MKFLQIAAALALASATEVVPEETNEVEVETEAGEVKEQQDTHLAQLVIQAIKGTDPRVIPKPRGISKTNANLIGRRTRTSNLGYTYHWQWVCEYMTWTPTNQFIFDHRSFDPKTMTLHRFGMIGWNKDCYWGMTGVKWIQPLQVNQIVPHKHTGKWYGTTKGNKGLSKVGGR